MTQQPEGLSAGEHVRAAAAQTLAAGPARLFSADREGSALGSDASRTEGVVDLHRRVARATVRHVTPEFESEMHSKLEGRDDPADEGQIVARAFMKTMSVETEYAYVGGATYMRIPEEGWADFSGDEPDGPLPVNHPLWLLDALLGTCACAAEADGDEVRGISTAHHRLTIDLAAADEQLPTGIMAPGPRPYRSLRRLAAEVWIDDQRLIRRMSYETELAKSAKSGFWRTTELWDFDADITVEVPAKDELVVPQCAIDERPE